MYFCIPLARTPCICVSHLPIGATYLAHLILIITLLYMCVCVCVCVCVSETFVLGNRALRAVLTVTVRK